MLLRNGHTVYPTSQIKNRFNCIAWIDITSVGSMCLIKLFVFNFATDNILDRVARQGLSFSLPGNIKIKVKTV